jgi:ligand-binding SRPBCC domain-containing protein
MKKGAHIQYALRLRGIPLRWLTEIEQWDPPHGFVDVQLKGPYRLCLQVARDVARIFDYRQQKIKVLFV